MKGLELSRQYYETLGKPLLEERFGAAAARFAVGLVGEGSECFGYDDAISADHDYGAGFCIWLTREDYEAIGEQVQQAYDTLPGTFLGVPARKETAMAGKRVGVLEIQSFYARFVGRYQPPQTMLEWLYLREDKLASAVNGAVFADPLGEFSRIRSQLARYYPEDVRIKKIAARCAVMAQAGQYNYARCMRRGDVVAAELALHEFLRAALSLVYLLNRTYCPYYKWQFYGLKRMMEENTGSFVLSGAVHQLEQLVETGQQRDAWGQPGENPYVNLRDKKVAIVERVCAMAAAELRNQGLTGRDDPFLQAHLGDIMGCIRDPELRRCHVLEG